MLCNASFFCFLRPTEGSILDLEGKYIDLKDYNIYPVLSNEQVRNFF